MTAITLRRSPPLQNSMASNGSSPSVTLSSGGTSFAAMTLGWFKRFMMSTSKVHLSLCLRFISPGTRHFFSAMYSSRLWKDYGKKAFILQIKLIIIINCTFCTITYKCGLTSCFQRTTWPKPPDPMIFSSIHSPLFTGWEIAIFSLLNWEKIKKQLTSLYKRNSPIFIMQYIYQFFWKYVLLSL